MLAMRNGCCVCRLMGDRAESSAFQKGARRPVGVRPSVQHISPFSCFPQHTPTSQAIAFQLPVRKAFSTHVLLKVQGFQTSSEKTILHPMTGEGNLYTDWYFGFAVFGDPD